jgi:RNA polymerase sigma-70 factor (ECF subfamily)
MATPGDNSISISRSVSSTLLEQLRLRRPDAWERFVRLYSPVIFRWCFKGGLSAEDAADVLQDTLASVMLHLSDFERSGPRSSFTAWLATITRNKIRDYYRRKQGKAEARGGTTAHMHLAEIPTPGEFSEESICPDGRTSAILSQRALESIRAEFEPRTWNAFWRTTVEDHAPAHVAEDLGMSVAAVYMAKSRILARLRHVLSELPQ